MPTSRRSPAVSLGLTAAMAAALTGCAQVGQSSDVGPAAPGATWTVETDPASAVPASETGAGEAGGDLVDVASEDPPSDEGADDGSAASDDTAEDALGGQQAPVEYAAVCVDQSSGSRVEDGQCDDIDPQVHHHGGSTGLLAWYFLRSGMMFPRVGSRVSGGSYSVPTTSSVVRGGVPRSGGKVAAASVAGTRTTVSTGGFGGSGRVGVGG